MKQLANILGMTEKQVEMAISNHLASLEKYNAMYEAYKGDKRDETVDTAQNNEGIVYYAGYPRYITTIINSYCMGKGIKFNYDNSIEEVGEETNKNGFNIYKLFSKGKTQKQLNVENEEAIKHINDWYKRQHVDEHDFKIGKNMSIFGKAVELMYVDDELENNNIKVKIKSIDPRNAFLFKLNDLNETVVGAMYYYKTEEDNIKAFLYTDSEIYEFDTKSIDGKDYILVDNTPHVFGSVPIIEWYNNDELMGDFEPTMSLINSYNSLMTDRVNDIKDFVDAILVVTGGTIDDKSVKDGGKLLEVSQEGADIKWLEKTLDQTQVGLYAKEIREDIATFGFVPNLTDKDFGNAQSGKSMSFKLIGMELLINEKEKHFSKGLRLRLKKLFNAWEFSNKGSFDYESIDFIYNHELPIGIDEYEVIGILNGIISQRSLLGLIPEIDDADAEMELIEEESEKRVKRSQSAFGSTALNYDTFKQDETEETE